MGQPTSDQQPIEDRMYVDLELFEAGLEAIQDLLGTGAFRILVGSGLRPSPFQFELRREDGALKDVLANHGLSFGNLSDVIGDLDDCLNALVSGSSPEKFVAVRSDPRRWEDGEHESPDVARRKLDLVVNTFDISSLKQRFWVKRTAKTPIPGRLDWEVLTKNADASGVLPGDSPIIVATIRLATEPGGSGPISLTDQLRQLNITVDSEDVGYMIDSLNRLQDSLIRAEENSHE